MSGKNYNGQLNQVTGSQPVSGLSGGSMLFSGQSNSYMSVQNNGQFLISQAFSLVLYINPADVSVSQNILLMAGLNSSVSLAMLSGGFVSLSVAGQTVASTSLPSSSLLPNSWSRLAIACDLTQPRVQLWLNGGLAVDSKSVPSGLASIILPSSGYLYIGGSGAGASSSYANFNGQLSCLKMYNSFVNFQSYSWNTELAQCFG